MAEGKPLVLVPIIAASERVQKFIPVQCVKAIKPSLLLLQSVWNFCWERLLVFRFLEVKTPQDSCWDVGLRGQGGNLVLNIECLLLWHINCNVFSHILKLGIMSGADWQLCFPYWNSRNAISQKQQWSLSQNRNWFSRINKSLNRKEIKKAVV